MASENNNNISLDESNVNSLQFLQAIHKRNMNQEEVFRVLNRIKIIIENELKKTINGSTLIDLSIRAYYYTLKRYHLTDSYLNGILKKSDEANNPNYYQILYNLLSMDYLDDLNIEEIKSNCLKNFKNYISQDNTILIFVLKTINILHKKYPFKDLTIINLDDIYFCLQIYNSNDIREEILLLFHNICCQKNCAFYYFEIISKFLPWTNKNKYFLLACVLQRNNLKELLNDTACNQVIFFAGLRLSLRYKELLVPGQFLVKVLCDQQCNDILDFFTDIIINGSKDEIKNLYIYWFSIISRKTDLFLIIQNHPYFSNWLKENIGFSKCSNIQIFNIIIIFNMFSKQLLMEQNSFFDKFIMELFLNCFQYNLDTQIFIYRFFVNNMNNFPIEKYLEFFYQFLDTHKSVDNAQFRNEILIKVPIIIKQIINNFPKLNDQRIVSLPVETSILLFFQKLNLMIIENIKEEKYQNKIFCLNLLAYILKTIYFNIDQKSNNECKHKLCKLLKNHNLFNFEKISLDLITLLNNPEDFEDTRILMINLLNLMPSQVSSNNLMKKIITLCYQEHIDTCTLSSVYASLLQNKLNDYKIILNFYDRLLLLLEENLRLFQVDPFLCCKKQGGHLFSFLNVLNIIVGFENVLKDYNFCKTLQILEETVNMILQMINLSNDRLYEICCPSFEDMDNSLEILIRKSTLYCSNHNESRKFLLKSFWYTLKASCELATTIGLITLKTKKYPENDHWYLEKCINIHKAILTKCRHKGAIEAAGTCIGKLTKSISRYLSSESKIYRILNASIVDLYSEHSKLVSITRRGAGFSAMFLHIIKNENPNSRPILQQSINNLLQILQKNSLKGKQCSTTNYDILEVLALHFICVLIRDTELKDSMKYYYSDILMVILIYIDNTEWTVCNAALQLFGALMPKIVGQMQRVHIDHLLVWEFANITFDEINRKFPTACEYILEYFVLKTSSTCSIILFLEFLHRVEHINIHHKSNNLFLWKIRKLMWSLLSHKCHKIRKLASLCFIRAHEFRNDLPRILFQISQIMFKIKNENFFESIILTLKWGLIKLREETQYIVKAYYIKTFENHLKTIITKTFLLVKTWKPYTICKLVELLNLLNFNQDSSVIKKIIEYSLNNVSFVGYEILLECLEKIKLNT